MLNYQRVSVWISSLDTTNIACFKDKKYQNNPKPMNIICFNRDKWPKPDLNHLNHLVLLSKWFVTILIPTYIPRIGDSPGLPSPVLWDDPAIATARCPAALVFGPFRDRSPRNRASCSWLQPGESRARDHKTKGDQSTQKMILVYAHS